MKPISVPDYVKKINRMSKAELTAGCKARYAAVSHESPEVSIVIPAYNEEENILLPLYSLVCNNTSYSYEIIVINNNSSDNTGAIVEGAGIPCVLETKQGVTHARNTGLSLAKGTYIINADADTIYPPKWIEKMVEPMMKDKGISLTYGQFAFISTTGESRFHLFLYEHFADAKRWYNKNFKEEAVNVYGFNSAFRRADGIAVSGFDHPPRTNEDGWLALKLRNGNFGRLHLVKDPEALVWTKDRRLQIDGGMAKATAIRIKRLLNVY